MKCKFCGAKLPPFRGCIAGPPWCSKCEKTRSKEINKQVSKNIKDVLGIELKGFK